MNELKIGMTDARIEREAVLTTIYSREKRRRIVWTASTTLTEMGIERYPHLPQANYRKMKKLLQALCDDGLLARRPNLHSRYTMKETAYERLGVDYAAIGGSRRTIAFPNREVL